MNSSNESAASATADVVDDELAARIERERAFHDDRFEEDEDRGTGAFYAAVSSATDQYRESVLAQTAGDCLEYGCGTASLSFDLGEAGCRSAGIDISSVAVNTAAAEAADRGLDINFLEMDAEALTFEDESFDLVYGSGILHHLDIERSRAQIMRVLRPGGRAVFLEPMGYNPLINVYRHFTPDIRTVDEHPLLRHDLAMLAEGTGDFSATFHGLTSLSAAPFLSRRGGQTYAELCRSLDKKLLAIPGVQLMAWMVVIEFTKREG